jgi:hypothetical protein
LATTTTVLTAQSFDQVRFELLLQAVVRIEAGSELGSGIVLHQLGDSAVVLTANHVVKSSTDIGVYFYGDPLKTRWTVQPPYDFSETDDLAVLRIRSRGARTPETPMLIAGANPEEGTVVRAIGNEGSNFWIHSADAQVVRETDSNEPALFRFTRNNVTRGYSGGPVFNRNLELVGMMVQIFRSDDLARALKVERILDGLRALGVTELNRLRVAEKGSSALEELTGRYAQLSRDEKSLAEFFARRKKEAEERKAPFRGEIDRTIFDAEAHLRDAKRYLDAKQVPSAQKSLDAAQESIQRLRAMQ